MTKKQNEHHDDNLIKIIILAGTTNWKVKIWYIRISKQNISTAFATLRFLACENPINSCIYSKSHIKVENNDFVLKWENSTAGQTMIDCFIKDISCQWDKQIPNKLFFQKTQQKVSNQSALTHEEAIKF